MIPTMRGVVAAAAVLTAAVLASAVVTALVSAAGKDPPDARPAAGRDGGPPDLAALQTRVREAARKASPAVVSVNGASGVVVTADGLVLSQHHVTHGGGGKPGAKTKVFFPDGKEVEAELLGADPLYDLSALKITGPGPYPHASLADGAPAVGDGVLKLGHPLGGPRDGRPPVVRFGRVLARTDDEFVTDCRLNGGDSGGPYFDLDGRVVGILRTSLSLREGFSWLGGGPGADPFLGRGYFPWKATAAPFVRGRLGVLRRGEIPPPTAAERDRDRAGGAALKAGPKLDPDRWTQGKASRDAFRDAVAAARASVVEVLAGDRVAALGTVVSGDGLVVTTAETVTAVAAGSDAVPGGLRCRLPGGKVVAAAVVGLDPDYNLALLRVGATGLRPVAWADGQGPPAGTLLAAPSAGEPPVGVGVLSVPRRDVRRPTPIDLRKPAAAAAPPAVLGSPVPGRGYWAEYAEGNAAAAGIRPGDLLVSVGDTPVRSHEDLFGCVRGRVAGERVAVRVLREGRPVDLTLALAADRTGRGGFDAVGFLPDFYPPTAFEHDLPLLAGECGGPVVGLDGKAVGVTVGRIAPQGCVAVPADRVVARLADLKAGKPLAAPPRAPAPSPRPPPAGKQVTVTIDDLRGKLEERAKRFHSLLIDYDVTAEALVEPRLLVAWELPAMRGGTARHREAFSGPKRLQDFTLPRVVAEDAPADDAPVDPVAPIEVAARRRAAASEAAAAREQGAVGHLFTWRDVPFRNRLLFDGKTAYGTMAANNKRVEIDPRYLGGGGLPLDYLSNIGLRPLDPAPTEQARRAPPDWLPGHFARYESVRVRPAEEVVDGAGCVVVEGKYADDVDGKRERVAETVWIDPALGYAPRRWEARIGDRLLWRRANDDFREFAPDCWLPLESVRTVVAPRWAAEHRGRPAVSYQMRVRWARVNDVPDAVFDPDRVFGP